MTEQQWEYCEVGLGKWQEDKKKKGWTYDCCIRYYSPTGQDVYHQLATLENILPYNPFTKAMGLLGAMGWELVSVQHGNWHGGTLPSDNARGSVIIWSNRVAYFKRPIIPGRAVDEPELAL